MLLKQVLQSSPQTQKAKGITLRLLIVVLLLLVSLLIFWAIADEIVLEHEIKFDNYLFHKIAFLTSPFDTKMMLFFTFFGSNVFLLPAYIVLILFFLFFKKTRRFSFDIIAIGITSTGLLFLMKDIFKRIRPSDPLIKNVSGFSFPSGHSFSAFTFFGLLVYFIWKSELKNQWKYLLSVFFILFASCIAFSRVYLHVHYPSDVIAGFCLSVLWLSISLWALNKFNKKSAV